MTSRTRALLEQAKKLSAEERESLAYELLQSVGDDEAPLSPAWRDEIDRRIERAVSGEAGPGVPWRNAMADIRKRVKKARGKKR